MRSLAEVLGGDGWQLTGSDAAAGRASSWNRWVTPGDSIDPALDLVIHSDAVPAGDRQRAEAAALGVPTISYPMALGRLLADRRGLAVAGTHGKSTTAAMLARILEAAGADPSFIFGAEYQDASPGGRRGQGEWMIAEACEYRENFRHLRPEMAVLLAIEADHFDYYRSWAQLEGAFRRLVAALPRDGRLLFAADCARARRVAGAASCESESFGLGPKGRPDWQADVERVTAGRHRFAVRRGRRLLGRIELTVPGRHNVVNALAAIAAAYHAGASWRVDRAGPGGIWRAAQAAGDGRRPAQTGRDRRLCAFADRNLRLVGHRAPDVSGPPGLVRLSAASGLAHRTSAGRVGHKSAKC